MSTLQELFAKVQAGTAQASDYEEIAKLSKAQADEQKKAEASAKSLIDTIKKANIAPQILTNLLAGEGLIVLPKTAQSKEIIFESDKMKFEGNDRETVFKVWAGRDFDADTKDVQNKWKSIKGKGKDYFLSKLTPAGKSYYETEAGKKYIDGLFA
ncbi:hypothetical protein [Burkholderia glumae]